MSTIKRVKISELLPDRRNANLHTERGVYMVGKSLEKLGAGRSILIDKDNEIIAGNLTTEQAAAMGLEEVLIVETDGRQLVAVKRTDMDLDDPATGAQEMAYADNRAADVSIDFDPDVIAEDIAKGLDLTDFWFDWEIEAMTAEPEDYNETWQGMPEYESEDKSPHKTLKVHFANADDVESFAALIGQDINEKTIYIWHPKQVRENLKSLAYTDES